MTLEETRRKTTAKCPSGFLSLQLLKMCISTMRKVLRKVVHARASAPLRVPPVPGAAFAADPLATVLAFLGFFCFICRILGNISNLWRGLRDSSLPLGGKNPAASDQIPMVRWGVVSPIISSTLEALDQHFSSPSSTLLPSCSICKYPILVTHPLS